MTSWKKAGVVRISRSNKVLVLDVWGLEPRKWLILDIEDVFDLIAGKRQEIDVLEGN